MLSYLFLPPEQSSFERDHLRRANRVALGFFWLNLPLFVGVAAMNATGPLLALELTLLVLAGPTLAYALFDNQRYTSVVQGITAMCMGGLLVHFGQGPLQIEMHFYFFSLLAVLALFANPMVIVAAAVTVTLHHTVIWALLPQSVFNYDASIWVIAVHATFVVVESIAAVYLARSFYDSVIGMERIVEARTRDLSAANESMSMVLAHVNQGLLTLDRQGHVARERSARVEDWLGPVPTTTQMSDYLRQIDPKAAEWFELGWEDLQAGIMPIDVTLEQLPQRIVHAEQHLAVRYIPISTGGDDFDRILVVLSDETQERANQRAETARRQQLVLFEQHQSNPEGLRAFLADTQSLVDGLTEASWIDLAVCRRWLHTIKGNSLSFGLDAMGATVHRIEDQLLDDDREPTHEELDELNSAWRAVTDAAAVFLTDGPSDVVEVDTHRIEQLRDALSQGPHSGELRALVQTLTHAPVSRRLAGLAGQAQRVAQRLGKDVAITVDGGGVYLPTGSWPSVWSAIIHLVRNALDHGIEDPEQRVATGKAPQGSLSLRSREVAGRVEISVSDDGGGIDWVALRRVAVGKGLPHATRADLIEALFTDGTSTAQATTDSSGRGVGMSALREAVRAEGGEVLLSSEQGRGTTWTLRLPIPQSAEQAA